MSAFLKKIIIFNSATLSHSPRGLSMQVEYHFVSDPGPRKDQRPAGNRFANKVTSVALAIQAVRRPDCASSRLFVFVAEEDDRLVTQSTATPEPGFPDLHPRSSRSLVRP